MYNRRGERKGIWTAKCKPKMIKVELNFEGISEVAPTITQFSEGLSIITSGTLLHGEQFYLLHTA